MTREDYISLDTHGNLNPDAYYIIENEPEQETDMPRITEYKEHIDFSKFHKIPDKVKARLKEVYGEDIDFRSQAQRYMEMLSQVQPAVFGEDVSQSYTFDVDTVGTTSGNLTTIDNITGIDGWTDVNTTINNE